MTRKILAVALLGAFVAVGILVAGCSDNRTITKGTAGFDIDNAVEEYFPLDEGYQTTFQVSYADGSSDIVTYEVGEVVQFGSLIAHEWKYSTASGSEETGYLVPTTRSLFFYENQRMSPEQILSLPLEVGESWSRYGESIYGDEADDVDTIWSDWEDYLDDKYGGDPEDGGTGGTLNKSFPTQGGNDMTVNGTEAIDVGSNLTFTHAIRITNSGSVNRENHYWYARGIGLVKFVIGANEGDAESGQVVGEMIEYDQ